MENNNNNNNTFDDDDDDEGFRECSASFIVDLSYQPPPFELNTAITSFHERTPRFGHPNDINLLISGSNNEQRDYLTGLLAASIAIFCLFISWMSLLWLFKCLGPSRVGFFSAYRQMPERPYKPDAVRRKERLMQNNKQPFQHNGVAAGYLESGELGHTNNNGGGGNSSSPSRGILKPVVNAPMKVAKAPIRMASKARKKKRELEKRQQFSKINDSFDENEHESNDRTDGNETKSQHDTTKESEEMQSRSFSGSFDITIANTEATKSNRGADTKMERLSDIDKEIIEKYTRDWKAYENEVYRRQDRIRRIRIGAGFCACGILISAVLFTVMTEQEFTQSFADFSNGLNQANNILVQAIGTAEAFETRQSSARESTRKFILQFNDICTTQTSSYCSNITEDTSLQDFDCDFSSLPFGVELSNVVTNFVETMNSLIEGLGDLRGDLIEMQDLLDKANTFYPKHGTAVFWSAAGCSLAVAILSMLLVGGMIYIELGQGQEPNGKERPLPGRFVCLRTYLILPLFAILLVVSWILAMVFIGLGIGSADLCYNTPDVPLLNLLNTVDDRFDSIIFPFMRYYIGGCPVQEAPRGLELGIQIFQQQILPSIAVLSDSMKLQDMNLFEEACGSGLGPFLAILHAMGNQVCILGSTMSDLRSLLDCELWHPFYRIMFHEAICTSATQGFTWAASTQTAMLVLGLVLLTLRVSFYELDEALVGSKMDDDAETVRACGCFQKKKRDDDDDEKAFKPSDQIRQGCFARCFGPQKPKGNIGEINITKKQEVNPVVASNDGSRDLEIESNSSDDKNANENQ